MSMNKNILIVFSIFVSLFMFNIVASADTSNKIVCNTLNETSCKTFRQCEWRDNACQENYVAENACHDNNIKKVLRFFGYLLIIAKVVIPLIIIGFGTFDLFKSVVDKDEKSFGKQLKQLGLRIVGGMIIFFIPTIIETFFGISDKLNIVKTNDYKACANCLLKPTDESLCVVDEN